MLEPHKSSSLLQADKEAFIIKKFIESKAFNFKVEDNHKDSFKLVETEKTKMQFDLFIKEENIIGEVYVTELPFNSGRKRKFQSDILKKLTYAKHKKDQNFEMYYFLTADEEKLKTIREDVKPDDFVEHDRSKSLIGKDTWLNLTLDVFDIKLFYFCVENDFWEKLKETRAKQKEGMAEN